MSVAARAPNRKLPAATRWLATAWTLASTADNLLIFVLLWIAGPQGWSGIETAVLVIAMRPPTLAGGALGGLGPGSAFTLPLLMMVGVTVIAVRLRTSPTYDVDRAPQTTRPRRRCSPRVVGLIALSVAYAPAPILAASAIGCSPAGIAACTIPDLRQR